MSEQKRYSWEQREKRLAEILRTEGKNPNGKEDFDRGLKLAAQGGTEPLKT